MRRAFLMTALAIGSGYLFGMTVPDYGIIQNNDGNDMSNYPDGKAITEEAFRSLRLNECSESNCRVIFYCPGVTAFTLCTKAGEFMSNDVSERKGHHNAAPQFKEKGLDALEMTIRFCREHKIGIWVTIRMNDAHDAGLKQLMPQYKKDHPDWLVSYDSASPGERRRLKCGSWSMLNYSKREVREYIFKFLSDLVGNYDVDGLDLDFCRHFLFFQSVALGGKASSEETAAMTDLMRRVRRMTREVGERRGREVWMSARTCDGFEYCRACGVDVENWLKEGLLDAWTATSYYQLEHWGISAAVAKKYGVKFYASMDESRIENCLLHYGPYKRKPFIVIQGRNSINTFAARFATAMANGCDGVNLFNLDDIANGDGAKRILSLNPRNPNTPERWYYAMERGMGGAEPQSYLVGGEKYCHTSRLQPGWPIEITPARPYEFRREMADERDAKDVLIEIADTTVCGGKLKLLVNGVRASELPYDTAQKQIHTFRICPKTLLKGLNTFSIRALENIQGMMLYDFRLRSIR